MSSKSDMGFAKEQKEYINLLADECEKINLEKALEYALDIRKFEIGLYWKRATYFWAFIAAIFVVYWVIISSDNPNIRPLYVLVVTIIGYIFSYSWYLVNRGSKYWQKNWEMHVDFLEDKIIGSLYKTVTNPHNYKWYKPLDGYPSSVSKINQMLSLVITFVWGILIFYSLTLMFVNCELIPLAGTTIAIVLIISLVIIFSTKSSLESEDHSKSFIYRKSSKS